MPNLITAFRLIAIFPLVYCIFSNTAYGGYIAATIMGLAAVSDWLDGFVARKTGKVTEFGKVFDPVADRIFFISVSIALLAKGVIPLAAGILLVLRDLLMMVGFKWIDNSGIRPEVNLAGKTTTAVLFCSLVYAVLRLPFSDFVFWAAVTLNILSGLNYAWIYFFADRRGQDA